MEGLLRNARLPSPAPVVLRLYEVLESGGAEDVAQIIEADPALATRLLRMANAAFYAPPAVDSVRDAIVRMGTVDVAALVLASEVMRIFRGIPEGRFSMSVFWEHSLWTACYSEALASARPTRAAAPLWLCGLLHDIGTLLLARQASAAYATVLERVDAEVPLLEAERETLGFTHAQLGAELLRSWRLPAVLGECAARHHEPYASLDEPSAIVAAANALAKDAGEDNGLPGLSAERMRQVSTAAKERFAGYRELFARNLR